jgi:hypothetical protein
MKKGDRVAELNGWALTIVPAFRLSRKCIRGKDRYHAVVFQHSFLEHLIHWKTDSRHSTKLKSLGDRILGPYFMRLPFFSSSSASWYSAK